MVKNNETADIWILNVERGLSVVVKTPQNYCVLYDLGSTSNFSPISILKDNNIFDSFSTYDESSSGYKKIAQCIISHPHYDHISDLNSENTSFIDKNSFYITCQNDKHEGTLSGHKIDFQRINNPDNSSDEIENYKSLYRNRSLPLSTLIHYDETNMKDFKLGYYYVTHKQASELFPKDDQQYSNSLSIVLYISYGSNSILIPGDITPEAFKLIIDGKCERRFTDYSIKQGNDKKINWAKNTSDQPILKTLLQKGLTYLLAPHHGLESGYPEYLFEVLDDKKPDLIILSDKPHNSDNSGSTHINYQNGQASIGRDHKGKPRYSLSTVKDGHIKISLSSMSSYTNSSNNLRDLF